MEPEIYSESNLKSGNTIEVRHGGGLAAGGWAVELKRAQRGGAASRGDGRVAAGCGLASNGGWRWRRPRFARLAGLGRGPPAAVSSWRTGGCGGAGAVFGVERVRRRGGSVGSRYNYIMLGIVII